MIPVVVISLLRSSERRKAISARLDALGVAFKFHDAIDGNLFTEADATRLCPRRASVARRFILSKQEIACLESHKQCLQAAIDSGAPFTCILEDDAWIEGDIGEFLDPTWLGNIAPFDVLKLGGDSDKASDDLAVPLGTHRYRHVCVPLHPMYSAIGYIVTQAGAKKLLSHIRKMGDTIDVCLFRRPAVDARILDLRPFPIIPGPFKSTIIHDPTFKNLGPWWRPIAIWLPHRLALIPTKWRRILAFTNSQGILGFRNLELVPYRRVPYRWTWTNVRSPVSRDSLSEGSLFRDSLSQDGLSQNSLSQNSLSQDSLSQDSLSQNSLSQDSRSGTH